MKSKLNRALYYNQLKAEKNKTKTMASIMCKSATPEHEACPGAVDRPKVSPLENTDLLLLAGTSSSSTVNLYTSH